MNKPRDPGTGLDQKRYLRWIAQFSGYRTPVTHGMAEQWIEQFSPADRDLAARILDAVLFINTQHIHTRFRETLKSIEGWHMRKANRKGRWFFVPFSGSAGESGDSMVHAFRMAAGMTTKRFNNLFIYRSQLVSAKPGPDDTVILIDDFSGTGRQACGYWKIFQELLSGGPRTILMLVAATKIALKKISDETEMEAVCGTTLHEKENLFSPECKYFTENDKKTVLKYCTAANADQPKGFGDAGLLVVLAHKSPNNSIPILHATSKEWTALFPR